MVEEVLGLPLLNLLYGKVETIDKLKVLTLGYSDCRNSNLFLQMPDGMLSV